MNRAIVGFGLQVIRFGGFYFSFPTCGAESEPSNFANIPPRFPFSTSPGKAPRRRDPPSACQPEVRFHIIASDSSHSSGAFSSLPQRRGEKKIIKKIKGFKM